MKYFLHDSDSFNDEKITELYLKFGYEGLGLFYTLLEKLAKQEMPIKTEVLKHKLHVGKKLNKCWKFMESLGIISSNNGETFNKQLLNKSGSYEIKKEKNRIRISEFRKNQQLNENVTPHSEGTEVVRNVTGNTDVTPSNIKIIKDKRREESRALDVDFSIAKELFSLMQVNDSKAKEPNFEKWAEEIERIHRIDGREYSEIRKVIAWCQNDSFWKTNILGAPKLRKQFPRLLLAMNAQAASKSIQIERPVYRPPNPVLPDTSKQVFPPEGFFSK